MAGRLQNEDFKTEAEIVAAGGAASQLLNDTKVWVTGNGINDTLDQAILSGQIGGGGGKNYLANPKFTAATGGIPNSWSVFKTTLTSLIPTGSIGAADAGITITQSGTSPLEGLFSGVLDGASAFAAGNGLISAPFTIDLEDQAKVMGWSFYYQAVTTNMDFSGTSANTWAVYIYDVTNSAWIQPAGVYNLVQGSGVGLASGTFQTTSNSTQYRIALVCINAEAAATTLKVDDFQLGPQKVVYGSPVTDWQTFTPTPTGFTASAIEGKWRRVGDSIEVRVRAVMSATVGGAYSVSAPFPADSTKFPSGSVNSFYGTGGYIDVSVNQGYIGTSFITSGSSPVIGVYGPAGNQWQAAGFPVAFGAGDILTFEITYPAAGLSSSVQMSNDTDTRVVAAAGNFSNTSIPTQGAEGSETRIEFLSTYIDTHSSTTVTTGSKYTVSVSGIYRVSALLADINSSGVFAVILKIYKNGSELLGRFARANDIASQSGLTGSALIQLNSGDYIDFRVFQNSGSPKTFATSSSWSIERLSGPATIAASETVAMARVISSVISVPNNITTALNFQYTGPSPEPLDTHNAYRLGAGYNPATGTWTTIPGYVVPVSGVYSVSATVLLNGAAVFKQLYLSKNGSQFAATANDNTFGSPFPLTTSGVVRCNAGDVLSVYYYHNTGSAVNVPTSTTAAWNTFNVERIG